MEKVTLYIPCFNASKYLKWCLESVLNQSYPIDEILIIDDGSTDDTVRMARQFPVKLISHGQNKGLAAARNTAFRKAKNEFVAALDADCVGRQNWLEELMKNFKDEQTAGVGGRLIEKYTSTLADQWRAQHMPQHWGDQEMEDPPFLFGCNTVIRKSIVSTLGFYNEKFKTNYEDVYLSKKILRNCFQLIYSPMAIVEHLRKDTMRSVLESFWKWNYYNHLSLHKMDKLNRKLGVHLGPWAGIVPDFLCSDFQNRRSKMLIVDILLIFYLSWLDVQDYFKTNKANE